jgi:hypothetical protein
LRDAFANIFAMRPGPRAFSTLSGIHSDGCPTLCGVPPLHQEPFGRVSPAHPPPNVSAWIATHGCDHVVGHIRFDSGRVFVFQGSLSRCSSRMMGNPQARFMEDCGPAMAPTHWTKCQSLAGNGIRGDRSSATFRSASLPGTGLQGSQGVALQQIGRFPGGIQQQAR